MLKRTLFLGITLWVVLLTKIGLVVFTPSSYLKYQALIQEKSPKKDLIIAMTHEREGVSKQLLLSQAGHRYKGYMTSSSSNLHIQCQGKKWSFIEHFPELWCSLENLEDKTFIKCLKAEKAFLDYNASSLVAQKARLSHQKKEDFSFDKEGEKRGEAQQIIIYFSSPISWEAQRLEMHIGEDLLSWKNTKDFNRFSAPGHLSKTNFVFTQILSHKRFNNIFCLC